MNKTTKMKLDAIRNKHHEAIFRMGLYHLFDVGVRHMTPELCEEAKCEIGNKANGMLSPAVQREIIDIAYELSQFCMSDLLMYVQGYISFAEQCTVTGYPISVYCNNEPGRIIFAEDYPDIEEELVEKLASGRLGEHEHRLDLLEEVLSLQGVRLIRVQPVVSLYLEGDL